MIREELIELLIVHEGKKLKPYRDTKGKLTIGIGRNLDDVGISDAEAMQMLYHDLDNVHRQVKDKYPWFEELNEARQDVILNMVFNLGINKFGEFAHFIAAVFNRDYVKASHEMINSNWSKQVGKRSVDLARMMLRGEYLPRNELVIPKKWP
jgi:lysozyme